MSLKRLVIVFLLLGLGFAGTATGGTHKYALSAGSGGQMQIGGGLPLPIQATCNATCTGTHFPPLLVGRVLSATVSQTTTRTMGQKLMVPKGVLSRPAHVPAPKILGQADNNPALYAVATNIKWTWPETARTFSLSRRTGNTTTTFDAGGGRTIRYSNDLNQKFGGPAHFALYLGAAGPVGGYPPPNGIAPAPGDLKANAAATLYIIAVQPTGQPPCTHTAFAGPNPACVALAAHLQPTGGTAVSRGLAAPGGGSGAPPFTTGPLVPFTLTTPGGTPGAFVPPTLVPTTSPTTVPGRRRYGPIPGIGVVKAGTGAAHPTGPRGTITLFAWTPGGGTGLTNMASSSGFPWTTGSLTIKATAAGGAGESWKIAGKDNRNAKGVGVIKMVSGALSQRTTTGDNANRGWIRLNLMSSPEPGVPALSPMALAATAGLMLLAAGYAMRRRLFA